jgi:hypothetical protein
MMRLPVIAVFVALAFVPARAEELRCPARANAAVVKVLYLFSVKDKTFATCVYSDSTDHAIDLAQRVQRGSGRRLPRRPRRRNARMPPDRLRADPMPHHMPDDIEF